MGRRSINTTKSGKYMNPTDQARKEARKKELKKNKKQRQMVRAAVLKGKDPHQILMELEKIDQMEFNVMQPSPLNEKVLKDKRKKLKDTLDRVLRMYNKDDPDKWAELKRMQVEYDRKRTALCTYYEAVKNAQQVQVDEIPLPLNSLSAEMQAVFSSLPTQIPLPSFIQPGLRPPMMPPQYLQPHHSILKKASAYADIGKEVVVEKKKEPPGVPVGPPPDLSDDEDERLHMDYLLPSKQKTIRFADEAEVENSAPIPITEMFVEEEKETDKTGEKDEEDEGEENEKAEKARPTSLQQRMLAMAGQDIDQFMKEMEEVHKRRKADRAADLENRLQALEKTGRGGVKKPSREESPPPGTRTLVVPKPLAQEATSQPDLPPPPAIRMPAPMAMGGMPPMMFRPPPPALMGIRLPPGPPPGLPPRLGVRMPPGPPPGMPPRMMRPHMPHPPGGGPMLLPQGNTVLSAAPQLISRPAQESSATIQAGAQIRNLSADVTRFLPTALRVRRDQKPARATAAKPHGHAELKHSEPMLPARNMQTKDDAYMQFMREMEGLL